MKRKIALFLTPLLVAALLLAGCGGKEPGESPAEPAATEAPAAEAGDDTREVSAAKAPTEDAAAEEEEPQLRPGEFSGSTYTSSYAGFGCTFGEGWTFADAKELQDLLGQSYQMLEEADTEDALDLESLDTVTDMLALSPDGLTNVSVAYSKISLAEKLIYLSDGEEGIIDTILSQSEQLIPLYEASGLAVGSIEKVKANFLGEEHYAMKSVFDADGVPCYILQLFGPFQGSYMVTTTVTSYVEDNTQAVAELFFLLEE